MSLCTNQHKRTLEQLSSIAAEKEELSQRCHELDEQVQYMFLTGQSILLSCDLEVLNFTSLKFTFVIIGSLGHQLQRGIFGPGGISICDLWIDHTTSAT